MNVVFLYSHDYRSEFDRFESGLVPAHRLFGAAHLSELGHEVSICEWPSWFRGRLRHRLVWRLWQALYVVWNQADLAAVVCTTETPAQTALFFRRIGLLRCPVLVMTVAVLSPANRTGLRRLAYAWLLSAADVVYCYASTQVSEVVKTFGLPSERVRFLPFGVDVEFFAVTTGPRERPHVLSVGTNAGKDFPTLMAALAPGQSCTVVTDAENIRIAVAAGAPKQVVFREHVPIDELRDLYRRAVHVVIPLRAESASSGQTVLLENLVSGRPVIISDVSGVADYLAGTGAIAFQAGDVAALRDLLQSTTAHPVRPEAVQLTRDRFSSLRLSRTLVDDVLALASRGLSQRATGPAREDEEVLDGFEGRSG